YDRRTLRRAGNHHQQHTPLSNLAPDTRVPPRPRPAHLRDQSRRSATTLRRTAAHWLRLLRGPWSKWTASRVAHDLDARRGSTRAQAYLVSPRFRGATRRRSNQFFNFYWSIARRGDESRIAQKACASNLRRACARSRQSHLQL